MATATAGVPRSFLWRSRNWISILVFVPTALFTVFSAPAASLGVWGEWACYTLGWVLFMAGGAYRWWATLYISGRKDTQVICTGPYSMSRHPLYFGTFLLGLSCAAFLQSLLFLVGLLVTGIVYLSITLPREESRLEAIYGDAYRDFQRRTPRFFPNWANYQSPESIVVNLSGLKAELFRAARWALIPLLAHLLWQARLEAWWPHWMTLP